MSMFLGIDAAASGLTAERLRMDVISNNLANINTTRTEEGGAYKRKYVVFKPRETDPNSFQAVLSRITDRPLPGSGVRAVAIEADQSEGPLVYDPGHPDANADGYVEHSNVNVVAEMVDMITAQRAYEANATVINSAKSMISKILEIGNH